MTDFVLGLAVGLPSGILVTGVAVYCCLDLAGKLAEALVGEESQD